MPEICRFDGIVIYMYADDHLPPHFHAKYSGEEAQVSITDGTVIRGRISAARGAQGGRVGQAAKSGTGESLGAVQATPGPRPDRAPAVSKQPSGQSRRPHPFNGGPGTCPAWPHAIGRGAT